jgi:putative transposase
MTRSPLLIQATDLAPLDLAVARYYEEHCTPPQQRRQLEEIRHGCPAREVGAGAKKNIITGLSSRINGDLRKLESMSCEALCALELEVFSGATAYYCQPRIFDVPRPRASRTYFNPATLDLLVYGKTGPYLVECKPEATLEKLVDRKPEEWVKNEAGYANLAHQRWSSISGIQVRVWAAPTPQAHYTSNLENLYAAKGEQLDDRQRRKAERLLARLADGPLSCDDAIDCVRGISSRTLWTILADGTIYGTVKSCPLELSDRFLLFADEEQALAIDRVNLDGLANSMRSVTRLESPLLTARTSDYKCSKERVERADRILIGVEENTRRMAPLVKLVCQARANGENPLEVCLTRFHQSGNREQRLTDQQEVEIDRVIRTRWQAPNADNVTTQLGLYHALKVACEKAGIKAPSRPSLVRRLECFSKEIRAEVTGGRKALHAVEDPVDPLHASLVKQTPWIRSHVDSTKWDQRLDPGVIDAMPYACPTVYVAIDSTGVPLGRAVMFGPSCRAYLGVLLRDIVVRHGYLPRFIMHDGGGEYRRWFEQILELTGMSEYQGPTGDPAKNSRAENGLGRLNTMLAHRLVGSTLPDRQGRKVDNKFKSYKTARMLFCEAVKLIDDALFDIGDTPGPHEPGSPFEKAAYSHDAVNCLGIPMTLNDDFLFITSIPITKVTPNGTASIRHEGRTFRSSELSRHLAMHKLLECRRDCVDPTLMWIKFPGAIVRASTSDALVARSLSQLELLYDLMSSPELRRVNAKRKEERDLAAYKRIRNAEASAPAVGHLKKAADDQSKREAGKPVPEEKNPAIDSWQDSIKAFPEESS